MEMATAPIAASAEFANHNPIGRSFTTSEKTCHCGASGQSFGGKERNVSSGEIAVMKSQYTGNTSMAQVRRVVP